MLIALYRELEEDLVPEWRAKYLNYKAGKIKVKAIARAVRHAEQSPSVNRRRISQIFSREEHSSPDSHLQPPSHLHGWASIPGIHEPSPAVDRTDSSLSYEGDDKIEHTGAGIPERQLLQSPTRFKEQAGSYGSIVASRDATPSIPPSLELPDPALDPGQPDSPPLSPHQSGAWTSGVVGQSRSSEDVNINNSGLSKIRSEDVAPVTTPTKKSVLWPRRHSVPARIFDQQKSRLKSVFIPKSHRETNINNGLADELIVLKYRESEFFAFMDIELAKIESFYLLKEKEATERLATLRMQLHLMRDTRIEEIRVSRRNGNAKSSLGAVASPTKCSSVGNWKTPLGGAIGKGRSRKTSNAMQQLATPSGPTPRPCATDSCRDFVRRQDLNEVSYRSAKRKLKVALIEFYRGLELLKAYADLNRKAFRKMNKKYDKVTNTRPAGRYVSEKVNKSWFVQSEVVENHMVSVEDLYARYFERGNRKVAISKLRGRSSRTYDHSSSSFRNGLTLSGGIVFGLHGAAYAVHRLYHGDDEVRVWTSYLLQIYGGFFLAVFHFLLFCLDCKIWSMSKINYAFVFEFDTRHALDWRQLAELPCLFFMLLGICMWLNFRWVNVMYIYWPVLLITLTVVILLLPARILYHRSRRWWAYSNWRLLLAGLYPVEFRDFFLGDMYCSQTYAMSNVALLFCLYINGWDNAPKCNSSHSRVMGLLSTLPSIWRSLQCLRRYRDTTNVFPHIVNLGKYTFSILYYTTLNLYRINNSKGLRALFITCACINAIYSSTWDVAMDWSLGNPYAKHSFLRKSLGFRRRWVYYLAMIIDPVLRFNWILYASFTHGFQHSAFISFIISFSEVCRRGMWSIFRVENEHCTNVARFRASRDVPLPYVIQTPSGPSLGEVPEQQSNAVQQENVPSEQQAATGFDVENGVENGSIRQRKASYAPDIARTLTRVGTMLAMAHAQDFERKNQLGILGKTADDENPHPVGGRDSSTEDEAEDDDEEEVEEIEAEVDRELEYQDGGKKTS
ncbi:hypothetical protein ACO22_02553 [Paracoccidioides brasiliensis]|uniref:SPX domain-containing protein n=1 Tax=Paracoccidioides brasiliensis TaxID=121759 RepID=A0A1D2JIG0_PARBR|nr:hypothetical protein ACO22_02553 [Paracoccidioides brasiliensis]